MENEMNRLENAILTTNEVLIEHISMTKDLNNGLLDSERKLAQHSYNINDLQEALADVRIRIKRNYRFLMVEMILLWMFAILSAIEIVHLRG